MSSKNELATLDLDALSTVTGGAPADNAAVTSALTSILDSVKTLSTQQTQQKGFGTNEMLMFMMLSQRKEQSAPVVVAPPGRVWYY
jgi:hypothetical protein